MTSKAEQEQARTASPQMQKLRDGLATAKKAAGMIQEVHADTLEERQLRLGKVAVLGPNTSEVKKASKDQYNANFAKRVAGQLSTIANKAPDDAENGFSVSLLHPDTDRYGRPKLPPQKQTLKVRRGQDATLFSITHEQETHPDHTSTFLLSDGGGLYQVDNETSERVSSSNVQHPLIESIANNEELKRLEKAGLPTALLFSGMDISKTLEDDMNIFHLAAVHHPDTYNLANVAKGIQDVKIQPLEPEPAPQGAFI